METGLSLMKTVLAELDKSVLVPLVLTKASSVTHETIKKKICCQGRQH